MELQLGFQTVDKGREVALHRVKPVAQFDQVQPPLSAFHLADRGLSAAEAVGKVARAKQSSTQLSTYFVGRTAFYRLRQSVERKRGDAFNLGKFHEAVLSHGTLPVKYLPELVK